ncbi:uncharacterized protein LOC127123872 [Lathyrus oleraceus]|uniref:uncharacterized protein LOC127123872 n=1 Tax=Pisum sativum TaxID=3888 RepID=UPI0021D11676|nr:uncharacterized protein LOC127123872 [Pisum sativum]
MLETQISPVAQQQATTVAPAGAFPGQPQVNLKGHANAIILQSGIELDRPIDPRIQSTGMHQDPGKITEKEDELKEEKSEKAVEKEEPYVPPPPYKPPILYPQRLVKPKSVGQFKKFVELLKQLNITIPFTEVITQMPSYAKFLKEILSNKWKIEDNETVTLTAECSAIIQNNMPPKLKDPGSFSIPYVIGKFVIDKTLCDLGSSISLMPLSICEMLKMGELRPTRMSIQLADRSVKFPVGMLENVPVHIGQFYISTDFIIMDIKEDSNIPIILGRPFLATVGAIIDVKKGKLTFEVDEEKVEFILTQFLKAPAIDDTCCLLDVIDECVREMENGQTSYFEILKILRPFTFEDENWRKEYQDDNLSECLALTPNHMPCPKKPTLELKTLPKNLRYEFLDIELERPVIVNGDLGQIEIKKLLHVLRKYPTALDYNI